MFQLLDAFETVLARVRRTEDHEVDFERISISDRINQLSDILRAKKRLLFEELFAADRTRADVIVTFLALLEMTRLRMTRVWQEAPYAPIQIELSVIEDEETPGDAATGVEMAAEPAPAPGEAGPPGVEPGS
jgi:segregation and condensation protein A